jgi:hypothetical protein
MPSTQKETYCLADRSVGECGCPQLGLVNLPFTGLLTSLGARWSIRLVCCRGRAAKGIEVGEEARAPTNSRHLPRAGSSPTLGPLASLAPPSRRGFFLDVPLCAATILLSKWDYSIVETTIEG